MSASKAFPRPVAVFSDRFIFTTLTEKEVTQAGLVPFHHPKTLKACSLFTCKWHLHMILHTLHLLMRS
jgi:hypothetical protein